MNNTVAIILAAGNSSRLGSPKQLIRFENDYLINRILKKIEKSICEKVVIVLGSKANEIAGKIKSSRSVVVINPDWQKGMGSSIKIGLEYAIEHTPDMDSALFFVCDQYKLTTGLINQIIESASENPDKIIASSYAGTRGIPALLPSKYFEEIMNIPNNKGCKEIIHSNINDVILVDFPGGELDIDEVGDLENIGQIY